MAASWERPGGTALEEGGHLGDQKKVLFEATQGSGDHMDGRCPLMGFGA